MPELPEVETTCRALRTHLLQRRIESVQLRRDDLRWPIARELRTLAGARIHAVVRRAKYLLLETESSLQSGAILAHLGMSGSMRVLPVGTPLRAHDHADFVLDSGQVLRFNDPRRFGALLWQASEQVHPLLANLGPEPLSADFDGRYLQSRSVGRRGPVKPFLMDQGIVVGVGNIYAAESLFLAGIDPRRSVARISLQRWQRLAEAVKRILSAAIERGGTTLRDFLSPDGQPGYFEQELMVYGRAGQACKQCGKVLKLAQLGPRQSAYCANCQR